MHVNLSKLPSRPKTYTLSFPELNGGLNIKELPYRIRENQSPVMRNLWWQDGVLQSRDGQSWLYHPETSLGVGYTCYETLFHGYAFFHIGAKLYYADPSSAVMSPVELQDSVPENRGTFFQYYDWLFYKNNGGFYRVRLGEEGEDAFVCSGVAEDAFVPVVIINGNPSVAGAGDLYQPENRLSAKKTVWFNAKSGETVYHLPVKAIDSVDLVVVDGSEKTATADYTVDAAAGTVTFSTAPPVTNPPTNNTVRITYSKENADAFSSIMGCEHAFVAGGDTNLCILLAGCGNQPNAVFWNSNDNLSMNPTYWPMSFYNFVGDTEERVTGFGRQYKDLIVFKEHSVGKLNFGTQTVDDRVSISFTYENINKKAGCDLPYSIQLVENNLVFCNTYQGVHVLRSSSAAYENNVECISHNVNGEGSRGLLSDVRAGGVVCSVDDDYRYWLCANGKVYLWDYRVSKESDPSWFYFTGVHGVSYFRDDTNCTYHLDGDGNITKFERTFEDYGEAIDKFYQFPILSFGRYDVLKDVESVVFVIRSEEDAHIKITYDTDYETREDLTDINSWTWLLQPRDMGGTSLGPAHSKAERYARVARRKPGCRHIRHFGMSLHNNRRKEDLAIVSARVFYKYSGEER